MRILLTGHLFFHTDNAAKFRALEVVNALEAEGHEVVVFDGLSPASPKPYRGKLPAGLVRARPAAGWWQRLTRSVGAGFALLSDPATAGSFDAVYCYGTELSWVVGAWRQARRNGARLIVDVPELYGLEDLFANLSAFRTRIGGWLGIFPVAPLLADTIVVPSRRFLALFGRVHRDVRLLPPFFGDFGTHEQPASDEKVVTLAYAGSPSNKEWLSLIFRALDQVPVELGRHILFRLVGVTMSDTESMIRTFGAHRLLERADIRIAAMGQTDVDTARTVVRSSDFSIVIRHHSIRINFGFPSKVAEAFRLGTPVISNLYSDIGCYLVDGENGFVLHDETEAGLRALLIRCLATTSADRAAMRVRAAGLGGGVFSAEHGRAVLEAILMGRQAVPALASQEAAP